MKKQNFRLVAGEFSPQDAKEVLSSLYTTKIDFHLMKNFSSTERFGKDDEMALKRIPELKKSLSEIYELLEKAMENNKWLKVTATVDIEFADKINSLDDSL